MNVRDVHSMSKLWYLIENAFWCFLGIRVYKIYCFKNIMNFDYETSNRFLYIMVFVCGLIGVLLTFKHRRNSINTAVNVLSGITLYTFIAYFCELGVFIILMVSLGVIGSVVYIIMTQKYSKSKASEKNKCFNKKRFSILGARTIISVCSSIVVFFLATTAATGMYLYRPSVEASDDSSSFIDYIDKNIDTFDLLEESKWQTLSNNRKLDVLQMVCNAERIRLGVQSSIRIKSRYFENNLQGAYLMVDRTVLINTQLLKEGKPREILECCTHECFHALQHELVELYDSVSEDQRNLMIFNTVEEYKTEFASYQDGYGEDFDQYYDQKVEEDARSYSSYAPDIYLDRAEKHKS